MSRRAARCTEAEIRRAIKAAEGFDAPKAVEIAPDGTIRIVLSDDGPVDNQESSRGTIRKIVL
jgi:hypothetical protein